MQKKKLTYFNSFAFQIDQQNKQRKLAEHIKNLAKINAANDIVTEIIAP
mgnify:CR=1 FL=1